MELFSCIKEPLPQYQCQCGTFQTNFSVHMKQHTQNGHTKILQDFNLYTCGCSFKTNSKYLIARHEFFHNCGTNKKTYRCDHCSFESTRSRRSIEDHILRKHVPLSETQWHYCDQCPKRFKVKKDLSIHAWYVHSNEVRRFKCEHCTYIAARKRSLDVHIVRKHAKFSEIQWYHCEHCPKKFKVAMNLQEHAKYAHPKQGQEQWHKCDKCDYKSLNKRNLKTHRYKHQQKFQCEHCGYECYSATALSAHQTRRHTDPSQIQWVQCEQCLKKFKHKYSLKGHIRSQHEHNDYKRRAFACEQCSYTSTRRMKLSDHVIRKHTELGGIRWIPCERCPKEFKTRADLRNHLRYTHPTREQMKWEKCEHCDYTTLRRNN